MNKTNMISINFRLVITMMTSHELSNEKVDKILHIIKNQFNYTNEIFRFTNKGFHEVDIDLFDVIFSSTDIYKDLDKLIYICEEILVTIDNSIDFIIGSLDTSSRVLEYEKNHDISSGLLITSQLIQGTNPYYSSKTCNAYVKNLDDDCFGVYSSV